MKKTTRNIVLLGVLTAIELLMVMTPIGSFAIGELKITFAMLPVAIAAIALGALGGTVIGTVWGLSSFLGCLGIGVGSKMLLTLFAVDPLLTFVLCFVPRVLDGLFVGLLCKGLEKVLPPYPAFAITGFCAAFFNTVMFLTTLVVFFGKSEYVGKLLEKFEISELTFITAIAFMAALAGVNAVVEMITSTVLTSAIGVGLHRARLIEVTSRKATGEAA